MTIRLHADEVTVTPPLARRLIDRQFPAFARLPLRALTSAGTDNTLFKLGDDLVVRLPRRPAAAGTVEREWRWLPELAPFLPLAAPVPLAFGKPDETYPFHWTIARWIEGHDAATHPPDKAKAADALAALLVALRAAPAADGPPAGCANFDRGLPLAARDAQVRGALTEARDMIDARVCEKLWDACLSTPPTGTKSWIHGDLHPANLIVRNEQLVGVIDFGCMAVADPACDIQVAWTLFDIRARRLFRARVGCDEAMWRRGAGWALSVALIQLPYYRQTSPAITRMALGAIKELLADELL